MTINNPPTVLITYALIGKVAISSSTIGQLAISAIGQLAISTAICQLAISAISQLATSTTICQLTISAIGQLAISTDIFQLANRGYCYVKKGKYTNIWTINNLMSYFLVA
jgi:hypothetical protein